MDLLGPLTEIGTTALANRAMSREAAKQRSWSEEQATTAFNRSMYASNTSYQRKMADLKKAGLNPLLAMSGGASSPQASIPSGQKADVKKAEIANSIAQMASAKQAKANAALTSEKVGTEKLIQQKILAESAMIDQQTRTSAATASRTQMDEQWIAAKIARDEAIGKVFQDAGDVYEFLKQFGADSKLQMHLLQQLKDAYFEYGNKMDKTIVDQYDKIKELIKKYSGGYVGKKIYDAWNGLNYPPAKIQSKKGE